MATDHGVELSLWNAERTQAEVHLPRTSAVHPRPGGRSSTRPGCPGDSPGRPSSSVSGSTELGRSTEPSAAGADGAFVRPRSKPPKVARRRPPTLLPSGTEPVVRRAGLRPRRRPPYCLRMSAPPSDGEQRQGIGDPGNQFHYYRLTDDDNRILFGGYDAVYAAGERPGSPPNVTTNSPPGWCNTCMTPFRRSRTSPSVRLGRRHRHLLTVQRSAGLRPVPAASAMSSVSPASAWARPGSARTPCSTGCSRSGRIGRP